MWGNFPQWISAGAACVVAGIALWGALKFGPVFENIRLREDNAKLDLTLRGLHEQISVSRALSLGQRDKTWDYVCRQFSVKVLGAASTLALWNYGGAARTATEALIGQGTVSVLSEAKLRSFSAALSSRTGKELLRADAIREELQLLMSVDQTAFNQLIERFIVANSDTLDHKLDPVISPSMSSDQRIGEFKRSQEILSKFRDLLGTFVNECERFSLPQAQ
jgi:hypothetical protein